VSEKANYTETERKYLPRFPDKLERFKPGAAVINQPYLSHPSEGFSLRLRERTKDGNTDHEATLKDMGAIAVHGLQRLEVPGGLSAERYAYYSADVPIIRKLRAEPHENVVIDYYEDGLVHVESEDPAAWQHFVQQHGFEDDFIDVTGDRTYDNEWRAHLDYMRRNKGIDAMKPQPDIDATAVVEQILSKHSGKPLVVAVGGRSGSGKSTLLHEVASQLRRQHIKPAWISTDVYNLGKKRLHEMGGGSWTNLDSNDAYDLQLCLAHIQMLKGGMVVPKYTFNYAVDEPRVEHVIHPAEVILVDGIKAHHPELREIADLSFVVPTPLATSVGRRILRDLRDRPKFADPSKNLGYYLEYAEPEYRALLND
jgi:uridine kinase